MSTHNIFFHGEIRKILFFFWLKNVPYLKLCHIVILYRGSDLVMKVGGLMGSKASQTRKKLNYHNDRNR